MIILFYFCGFPDNLERSILRQFFYYLKDFLLMDELLEMCCFLAIELVETVRLS
jgi:hypothetical protein